MKRKLLSILLVAVVAFTTMPLQIFAQSETEDPRTTKPDWTGYTAISTKEQLDAVRNDLDGKYYLTDDIVFTEQDFSEGGAFYNGGQCWLPIGTDAEHPFTGTFDGNGHMITGLQVTLDDANYAGLFGYITDGEVKSLGLHNSVITTTDDNADSYAGGIAGYVNGNCTITNCYNTGSVSASSSSFSVSSYVGGIVGMMYGGTIASCYNTGTVTSSYAAGGIAGAMNCSSMITNCYNTGTVTFSDSSSSAYSSIGGIAGEVYESTITHCYNTGTVTFSFRTYPSAGGIAGYVNGQATIGDCYYLNHTPRGLGQSFGDAVCCDYEEMTSQKTFVGFDFDSVWTMNGSGEYQLPELRETPFVVDGEELVSVELVALPCTTVYIVDVDTLDLSGAFLKHTYSNGLSFPIPVTEEMVDGFDNTKMGQQTITVNDTGFTVQFYVTICKENTAEFAGGVGTADSPYLVSTKSQLDAIRNYPTSHFRMENNIIFTEQDFLEGGAFYNDGQGWMPIGTNEKPFEGVFDGNGYTITGLQVTLDNDVYAGLFAYIRNGSVKNLGLRDSVITAKYNDSYSYAGGIAGKMYGSTIDGCYNTGDVSSCCSGGIAGYVGGSSIITNCFNTGTVTDIDSSPFTSFAGGIGGNVDRSVIADSYNIGAVTTDETISCYIGGIAGGAYRSTVTNCYNTGILTSAYYGVGGIAGDADRYSAFAGCYYLDNISRGIGQGPGDVVCCTYEEMTKRETFIGFDFETAWTMAGKGGYQLPGLQENNGVTHYNAVEANCHQTGTVAYWSCALSAGKYYDDAECTTEITTISTPIDPDNHDGGVETRDAVDPTFCKDGYTGDTYCVGCGNWIAYGTAIPALNIEEYLADVANGQWFTPYIAYCLDAGLMKGQGDKDAVGREYFRPDNSMTRAELVTVLYNMEGQPPVAFEAIFDDVTSDKWFATQVTWASQNGLVFGTGDKIFEPDTPISRQDLATILYRYAVDYKGIEMNVENVDQLLAVFTDANRVANYAKVAMAAMNQAGVITGDGDRLKPQENATRAEVASMLSRYLPNVLQSTNANGN